jgi:NAD(P)-dependent dehydrogenase (short-subunit alcohol dehydrogenase family)
MAPELLQLRVRRLSSRRSTLGNATEMNDLADRTILITGATDGLGRALAGEVAARGATVLLHGRDPERCKRTAEEIRAHSGNERLWLYLADYSRLGDVRAMADRIVAEHEALHVLVNNAGIGTTIPGGGARMESDDGYELRFQVNYLAGYLLTRMLEPLLARSAPARIVNVSSAGQMPIDFNDVMLSRDYSPTHAYCQSKLAQVMHTVDLAEGHDPAALAANCLHPATYMPTKIVLAARGSATSTLQQGVDATLRLVLAPELAAVSGRYFNGQRVEEAHRQAYDRDARRQLRALSERLVGPVLSASRS